MKFKKIPSPYIKVILDRLFRLKPAYIRYQRVFDDIINKFLIRENNDTADFSHLNTDEKIKLASAIFNSTVQQKSQEDILLQEYIKDEEKRLFTHNAQSASYLDAKLNYSAALDFVNSDEDLKLNIRQMLAFKKTKEDPKKLRKKYSLLYPVEKILLCEGATEEILLEQLCLICGYDFKKEGVYVLGAGGKNQVARKYYDMVEEFKIPIFILLDSDAVATKELIEAKLRSSDKIYIIKNGEFEDILPENLITKALNARYKDLYECCVEDFRKGEKRTKELYEIFKQNGFGEYKKAEFAKTLKEYIKNFPPESDGLGEEIKTITHQIKEL